MFSAILALALCGQPAPTLGWHWAHTPAGVVQVYGHLRDGRVYPVAQPTIGPRPITITVPWPSMPYGGCPGGVCPAR